MTTLKTFKDKAAIEGGIKDLRKMVRDTSAHVQGLIVSIISHMAGDGRGDGSLAMRLVQALPNTNARTYAIRFFEYFGGLGINLDKGEYRRLQPANKRAPFARGHADGYDLDGARAFQWDEPVDANGERYPWYLGPTPKQITPNTLIQFSDTIISFAERIDKQLDATKEVNGKLQPVYNLSENDRLVAKRVLNLVRRVGSAAGNHGRMTELEQETARIEEQLQQDDSLLKSLEPDAPAEDETGTAQAVAGGAAG